MRAPKVFRLTLAIRGDPGAFIIALFFTAGQKLDGLVMALIALAALIWLNLKHQQPMAPMILLGMVMWFCVLSSGAARTLSGVICAATWAHVQRVACLANIGFTVSLFIGPVVPAIQGKTVLMLSNAKAPVPWANPPGGMKDALGFFGSEIPPGGPQAGGWAPLPQRMSAPQSRVARINDRMSRAASGILVPGPKIALTPMPFRKS